MSQLQLHSNPPLSNPHPVFEILKTGNQFYNHQMELILTHTATNDQNMKKLEKVNNLLGFIQDNRKTPLNFDTDEVRQMVADLHADFPDTNILPNDFLDKVATYSESEWDRFENRLMNQEKPLMSGFNLNMLEIEQLLNDRNSVFDIISEILKEYREGTRSIIRHLGEK